MRLCSVFLFHNVSSFYFYQAEKEGLLEIKVHIDKENPITGQTYYEEIKQLYYLVRAYCFPNKNSSYSVEQPITLDKP